MSDRDFAMQHMAWVGDGVSIASIVAAFAGLLPAIATIGAIIWYAIMIYDWFDKRRAVAPCPVKQEDQND